MPTTNLELKQRPRWRVIATEFCEQMRENLGPQTYYAVGLVLQKGLPYLLVPVLIRLYGEHVYASYVLFYSSVLMVANILALSVPNAIIAFWYSEQDKARLCWTFLVLLVLTHLAFGTLLGPVVFLLFQRSFGGRALQLAVLTVAFAAIYNVNVFLTGVCRARNYAKGYFAAQVISALVLIAGVICLRNGGTLGFLIAAFMLSVACQDVYLLRGLVPMLRHASLHFDRALAKRVFGYALPLLPHVQLTVFFFWIDKYAVRQAFSADQFTAYTVSFQYAFAQSFLAQVLAIHSFPLICRCIADHDDRKFRALVRSYNLLLAVIGLAWIAGIVFLQHVLAGRLRINSAAFAVLGIAFLLWNIAGNYINILWARFRTRLVTVIMLGAAIVLVMVLATGVLLHQLLLCCLAHLACAATALVVLVVTERRQRRHAAAISTCANPSLQLD